MKDTDILGCKIDSSPSHRMVECDCLHEGQDAMFGYKFRVARLYDGATWRCTTCGREAHVVS